MQQSRVRSRIGRPLPYCVLVLAALVAATPASARRFTECPSVDVVLTRTIDTKHARPGDRFQFKTLHPVWIALHKVPRGTFGAGFIETLDHSHGSGRSGYLILNAQYLKLVDGAHVPVSFAPGSSGRSEAYVTAGNTDVPGGFGYTPLTVVTSAYNLFHHGKDAALVAGTRFPVVVGDGLSEGSCRLSWMQ